MADHRHLGFSGSNNGFFDNPLYEFLYVVNRDHSSKLLILFLKKIAFFAFWRQDPKWRMFIILCFRGPIIGSLKSPCTTSYRSSMATIALNCLVFEKLAFYLHFCDRQTNRQTNKQMDSIDALSRSRCRERRLNNLNKISSE